MTKINFKKITTDAIVPIHGSAGAAGWDLYANFQDSDSNQAKCIESGTSYMVGTGIAVEIPKGYVGLIFARSGLASKQGLRPANCVGVIDSDYRGELKVALHNDLNKNGWIGSGERIAQLVIVPYLEFELN